MVSLSELHERIAGIPDPELPVVTIGDLGILREVRTDGPSVEVRITPTYVGCPALDVIRTEIRRVLEDAGFPDGKVSVVFAPPWGTGDISAEGRRKLAAAGIAPPSADAPACPQCGSPHTEVLSAFGATLCQSLRRCTSCREPFPAMKPH